jgi:hypothetical protein
MSLFRIFNRCSCGGTDFERSGIEAIKDKKYTDHIVKYRCKKCGKMITVGFRPGESS